MIHLYAPPGLFPETLCGLNRAWAEPYAAVYGHQSHLVNCPDCLARQARALQAEPYTAGDAARLRRGVRWSLLFSVPFWAALIIAVWLVLT